MSEADAGSPTLERGENMPIIEIDTSHSTHPWVLVVHRSIRGQTSREYHRYATEEEAKAASRNYSIYESCYLIELFVDAGCLHAIG